MRRFAALFAALDATTRTSEKVAALADYFRAAPPRDAVWAVHFLSGRRLRRLVPAADLRRWAMEAAGVPEWLFELSYADVGDLAETVALLLPEPEPGAPVPLHRVVEDRVLRLRSLDDEGRRQVLLETWSSLGPTDRLVYNKLITGGFRVGVSAGLVVRGLARATGLPADALTHRLMGHWEPTAEFYGRLVDPDLDDAATSRPYPFCLAHPLADPADLEGPADAWQVEWKWDGIRAQVVRRGGRVFIWTRGGELATDAFPEVAEAARALPDGTVLDGELLAWRDGVLPFDQMQRRIGRKKVGRKLLSDVPVVLKAFDLVEDGGEDLRDAPLSVRRERLERRVRSAGMGPVGLSECLEAATWDDVAAARDASRDRGVEGVMLKRLDGVYATGRPRGLWWKWKVTPHTVDAVLVYAQPGHGRRAGLYTDYTFAVWDQDSLVPFAKAYSGLSDAEIREVDRFVRQHTIERFGPVRSVRPEIVIEIAFEGIWRSRRHKSGVAVRFPRMHRRRTDLRAEDADTLDTLRALLRDGEDGPDE